MGDVAILENDVMHVFITGGTGFVGQAVVKDLVAAGHTVTALARSDQNAETLTALGAKVERGSLTDLDVLTRGAGAADGVIHTAFQHDWSNFAQSCEMDRAAIEALGAGVKGSQRPLLVTSGVALLAHGRPATEEDLQRERHPGFPRVSEPTAWKLADEGVRASIVRLPPTTHGRGDHGFIPMLIEVARRTGVSAYVGDGANRWAATHRSDAAQVYRLALEHGAEGGPFHPIAEEGVPFKEIAAAIAKGLGVPLGSKSPEEAQAHFGWFATFAGLELSAESQRTRNLLGWTPSGPGLLQDLAEGGYFDA
jgi:nucleoside-diphosphate-sugar epimerase